MLRRLFGGDGRGWLPLRLNCHATADRSNGGATCQAGSSPFDGPLGPVNPMKGANALRTLMALLVVCFVPSATFAEKAKPHQCHRLSVAYKRLLCYDKTTNFTGKSLQALTPPTKPTQDGWSPLGGARPKKTDWRIDTSTSRMNDTKTVMLTTKAKEPVTCLFGTKVRMTLGIECRENTTSVFFFGECFFVSNRYSSHGLADFRIDNGKPFKKKMVASTNNKALFHPKPISFIKKLFGGERLLYRVTPHRDGPVLAEFNISGIEHEIKPLRKACGW